MPSHPPQTDHRNTKPQNGFAALGVPQPLVASLAAGGIDTPFPIQTATLPDALAGRDVLGRGRTGSGKTVAFSLPTVTRLAESARPRTPGRPRALVLVPTRELANQVATVLQPLAAAMGQRVMTVFGGVGQNPQVRALEAGVDICVATPGRLEDLIRQRHCRLDAVEVTILDEADHMADLGFLPAVKRLLDATPQGTQRLLFSATLDKDVDVLVSRYLNRPVRHSVEPDAAASVEMAHHVLIVSATQKTSVVTALVGGQGRTLAFTRTKHSAKKLAKQLTAAGVPAVDLHGNLSQNARERNLAAFGEGDVRVLVATDIAARGIHVDDVALVVHVDPPTEHKAYLHRSGRTARAGARGIVVTVGTPEQRGDVRLLMKQASITPTVRTVAPGDPAIEDLSGPPAPRVQPAPVVPQQQTRASRPVGDRSGDDRSGGDRSGGDRSGGDRSAGGRSSGGRSSAGRTAGGRSGGGRAGGERSGAGRPAGGKKSATRADATSTPTRPAAPGAPTPGRHSASAFSSRGRRGGR